LLILPSAKPVVLPCANMQSAHDRRCASLYMLTVGSLVFPAGQAPCCSAGSEHHLRSHRPLQGAVRGRILRCGCTPARWWHCEGILTAAVPFWLPRVWQELAPLQYLIVPKVMASTCNAVPPTVVLSVLCQLMTVGMPRCSGISAKRAPQGSMWRACRLFAELPSAISRHRATSSHTLLRLRARAHGAACFATLLCCA